MSESDALILLDRSLLIQLCLLGVHVGENTSTGFLIKLKNFVCDNILDAFFGQLVQLVPVVGLVDQLVLQTALRVLLSSLPSIL